MAVAMTTEADPVLYDPVARRFDSGLLRLAMVRRRLNIEDMVRQSKLAKSTVAQARAGHRVAESTAIAIFEVLARISPLEIL